MTRFGGSSCAPKQPSTLADVANPEEPPTALPRPDKTANLSATSPCVRTRISPESPHRTSNPGQASVEDRSRKWRLPQSIHSPTRTWRPRSAPNLPSIPVKCDRRPNHTHPPDSKPNISLPNFADNFAPPAHTQTMTVDRPTTSSSRRNQSAAFASPRPENWREPRQMACINGERE